MELAKFIWIFLLSPILKLPKLIWKKIRPIWKKIKPKLSFKRVFLVILLFALGNIGLIIYVGQENTIYSWDDGTYYEMTLDMSNQIGNDSFFNSVEESVNEDYTAFSALPLALALKLLKWDGNRTAYILAIFNLYLVPSMLLAGYLIGRLFNKQRYKIMLVTIIVSSLAPLIMTPIALGRIDACGLPIILAITALSLAKKSARKYKPLRYVGRVVIIGLLVAVLVISRRTYLYWVVSAATAGGIVLLAFDKSRQKKHKIIEYIVEVIGVAGISLLTIFAVARPQFEKIFLNYRSLYENNRSDPIAQIFSMLSYVGLLMTFLIIFSAVIAIRSKNSKISKANIFACLQIFIVAVLFLFSQDFDEHHYYLFAPSIILLLVSGITLIRSRHLKWGFLVAMSINSLNTYAVGINTPLFSQPYLPKRRDDVENIKALGEYVEGLNGSVYVLTFSDTFNQSIIRNSFFPELDRPANIVLKVSNWDSRDGFPKHFWDMDYVVVEYPYEARRPETSRAVTILNGYIISDRMKNLNLIKEFNLQNDATVRVYKKMTTYDNQIIEAVDAEMKQHYPDNPSLWAK